MKIGNSIIRLKSIGSTNQHLLEIATSNVKPVDGDLLFAEFQTEGQGMGNNIWESEAGKNLTFSLYLEPEFLLAEKQFLLNKAISLAIYDFIKTILPDKIVKIKWPNDIYIDGNKVAGILIHHIIQGNHILYSVVGVGININQGVFLSDAPNPVSIINYFEEELDIEMCLTQVCHFLNERYIQLSENNFVLLNKDYLHALYRYKQIWKYKIQESRALFSGQIIGVNDFGQLIITDDLGNRNEFGFKEIEFII